jgi:site-specific DNA-methyltransferase (adenine-specific)
MAARSRTERSHGVPDPQRRGAPVPRGGGDVKPYYADEWVTLFNADWRDVAPSVVPDLVLADPPYGVKLKTRYADARPNAMRISKWGNNNHPPIAGDDKPFDPSPFLGYPGVILWGANYYADKLPPRGSWLVWDKRDGITPNDQADAELAWVSGVTGTVPRLFAHRWSGVIRASENAERVLHPTQKPVALMSWCLSFFPDVRLVFDPFCGSGPVPRACKDRGVRCVAAELVEEYCERAAERCRQEILNFGAA